MYRFFLWLHIVAIISWMAGILYLYRLFIYHRERGLTIQGLKNSEIHPLLSLMEFRLYRYITFPAMIVAYFAGLSMIAMQPALLQGGWLHIKITAVLLLSVATLYGGVYQRRFASESNLIPTSRTFRFLNEVPTLLMLIIVGMVIFRPF